MQGSIEPKSRNSLSGECLQNIVVQEYVAHLQPKSLISDELIAANIMQALNRFTGQSLAKPMSRIFTLSILIITLCPVGKEFEGDLEVNILLHSYLFTDLQWPGPWPIMSRT